MMFPLATEQTAVDRDAGSRGSAVGACGAAFEAPVAGMVAKCPPTLLHASGSGESGGGATFLCGPRLVGVVSATILGRPERAAALAAGRRNHRRELRRVEHGERANLRAGGWGGEGEVVVRCVRVSFFRGKKRKGGGEEKTVGVKWRRKKNKTRQVSSTRKDVRRAMGLASKSPRVFSTIPRFAHLMVLTIGR